MSIHVYYHKIPAFFNRSKRFNFVEEKKKKKNKNNKANKQHKIQQKSKLK